MIKQYISVVDWINKVVGWMLALMMTLMSVFIFWQVLARKALGASLSWSEEISRFMMVWVVLLGAAYALKKGELIAVEILPELLSEKGEKLIFIIVNVISIVFYFVLMIYGWEIAQSVAVQVAPGTKISMFWPYLALPAGGLLMILNTIYLIIKKLS